MLSEPVLQTVEGDGYESVVYGEDHDTGLRAFIAIHSTVLGPALGGTRMLPYQSDSDALGDVLRLAEGMSLKAAAAGLDLGGGKAVILGDPHTDKTPALLHAYGKMVDKLSGSYVTAEDVGTTVADLVEVSRTTRHVSGLPRSLGGSGDPSPMTARGVVAAMRAVADRLWASRDLGDRKIALQGVGKVGSSLARLLSAEGAKVAVADTDHRAALEISRETGADLVEPDSILSEECDLLAPCALGAVLHAESIRTLRCVAIVGSANNQLEEGEDADRLAERAILYIPDYVANAGGIINISVEFEPGGYDPSIAAKRVDSIEETVKAILVEATSSDVTPTEAATRRALQRLHSAGSP